MFDVILLMPLLAEIGAVLTTTYWACLIVGGGLVVLSALGGSDSDVDVETDVGFDVDADADFDFDADTEFEIDADAEIDMGGHAGVAHAGHVAANLSTWFSMRFVVFFAAVFGVVGVVLTHMSEQGVWATLGLSIVGGLVVGQCVHQLFRYIRQTSGDSKPQPQDYVNKLARVTIAITPPDKGEVALQVRQTRRYVPAVASSEAAGFKVGTDVVVVAYRAGVARVVSKEEFERKAGLK